MDTRPFIWTHLFAPVMITTLSMSDRAVSGRSSKKNTETTREFSSNWESSTPRPIPGEAVSLYAGAADTWCDWMSANSWPISVHYGKRRGSK